MRGTRCTLAAVAAVLFTTTPALAHPGHGGGLAHDVFWALAVLAAIGAIGTAVVLRFVLRVRRD